MRNMTAAATARVRSEVYRQTVAANDTTMVRASRDLAGRDEHDDASATSSRSTDHAAGSSTKRETEGSSMRVQEADDVDRAC